MSNLYQPNTPTAEISYREKDMIFGFEPSPLFSHLIETKMHKVLIIIIQKEFAYTANVNLGLYFIY